LRKTFAKIAGVEMKLPVRGSLLALAAMTASAAVGQSGDADGRCHVAVYKLGDGSLVDVAPEAGGLRWRTLAGRTGRLRPDGQLGWTSSLGWTDEPDQVTVKFGPCGSGTIQFEGKPGKTVPLSVTDVKFRSGEVTLAGRLVLPDSARAVPIMVVGHGSEKHSALLNAFRQRLYPATGEVGVFVYDKRGTGASEGSYTQDFDVLATDAAAAMVEARRLAGSRGSRFGFQGGSQAGWVLPLAAQKAESDFVIVGYGIAASPLAEDRTETLQGLARKGWGADVASKAAEVMDATAAVMASRFTAGFDRLKAAVAKYGQEPWFKDLEGEFTGEVAKAAALYPEDVLRREGAKRDEGTTWTFDALASLRRLQAPLLWMIAAEDSEGPGPESRANVLQLSEEGRPVSVAIFPDTEHGLHTFRVIEGGRREETGYAPGYFRMELEFATTGRLTGKYQGVEVRLPTGS
jgi:uncharacterized protein